MRSCAVCKNKVSKRGGHFFYVPKCETRRQKWSAICKVNLTPNSRLCIDHFSRAHVIIAGRRCLLMPNAEPVMQNHHNDPLAGLPDPYEPLINSAYRTLFDKPLQEYPEAAEHPMEIENGNVGPFQAQQTQTKVNSLKSQLAPANSVVDSKRKIFTNGHIKELMGPDDLCRICAKTIEGEDALRLFEDENSTLLLKIKDLTGIQLSNETGLPKLICLDCNNDISEAYKKFREDFLKVQALFNFHIRGIKQQKFVDEEETNISVSDYEPIFEEEKEINTRSNEIISFEDANGFELNSCDDNALEDTENGAKLEYIDRIDAFSDLEVKEIGESDEEFRKPINEKDAKKNPKVFVCEQCGCQFNSRTDFKIHLNRHSGIKRYDCELCPDKFTTNGELNRHMRTHTGEKPFPCRFCSRRYTCGSQRIKHERTHTNERPYACHLCGKSFTVSTILKNHMLTHTGEKVFKCDLCNREFARKTHLDVHFTTKMHKEAVEGRQFTDKCKTERSYVCSVCDRSFKLSNTLKNHMLTHTGVKDFKCDACNKAFARKSQLDAHFTTKIHKQSVENTELLEFLE